MKVWQPGTHLTMERGAQVGDWSWRRTRRRLAELARLTKPYKRRTAIALFIFDWRLALATLSVIPLMSIATVLFRVRSTRAYRAVRERLGLVTATLAEDIAGMRVVQAFTREERNIAHFREVNARYREATQQTVVLSSLYFPFV